MEQQAASLKSLPGSFWTTTENGRGDPERRARALLGSAASPAMGKQGAPHCFARTLDFEEPIILRTYVPLIRLLRTEWTDHALDFYIIVKAHVARLTRIIEPLSGDPSLTQRAPNLSAEFEREVQRPLHPVLQARPKTAARPEGAPREKQPHAAESGESNPAR